MLNRDHPSHRRPHDGGVGAPLLNKPASQVKRKAAIADIGFGN
jgi:hypothetical protein